jgi:hypothetical protein
VLEHLGGDDAIEGRVGEGERERVCVHDHARRTRRRLAGGAHGGHQRADVVQRVGLRVERDDGRAAAQGLERVPATAAPEVEHTVAGAHVQPVEVDGEHQPRHSSSSA